MGIHVYRVEIDIDGKKYGPFSANVYDKRLEGVTSRYRRALRGPIREPLEDGCSVFHSGMVCGAKSVVDMLHWIPSRFVFDELASFGFKISEYVVPENRIYAGRSQVTWSPRDAVFVGHLTLCELKNRWRSARRGSVRQCRCCS